MNVQHRLIALILGLTMSSLRANDSTPVFATPADVVAAAHAARNCGDHEAAFDFMTPGAIAKFVESIVTTMEDSQPDVNTPDERKVLNELADKYHVPHFKTHSAGELEKTAKRLTDAIADQKGFAKDYTRLSLGPSPANPPAAPPADPNPAKLQNLKIDAAGLTATGDLVRVIGNTTQLQPLRFCKINGSWLIDDLLLN